MICFPNTYVRANFKLYPIHLSSDSLEQGVLQGASLVLRVYASVAELHWAVRFLVCWLWQPAYERLRTLVSAKLLSFIVFVFYAK